MNLRSTAVLLDKVIWRGAGEQGYTCVYADQPGHYRNVCHPPTCAAGLVVVGCMFAVGWLYGGGGEMI